MDPKDHIEPAPDMLTQAEAGPLAAMEAALEGKPAPDPQPGDALPPPDSAPRAPEGEGESDPDDNANPTEAPKPDDKKTVEPTDPAADDPKVEPATGPEGPQKRPSDEFGELPADVPAKTRERFETMRTKYDELAAQAEQSTARERQWVETVQSTGASPEQFGTTLEYLRAVNSGTPEGLRAAYDMMQAEIATLAKELNLEVPGVHDPLAGHPDLQELVEEGTPRAAALEIAAARASARLRESHVSTSEAVSHQQQVQNAGLQAVEQYGLQMRAIDPAYAVKAKAIEPMVRRVVANLPPSEWAGAVRELYEGVSHLTAPAAAPPPTVDVTPLRPSGSPGAGGMAKAPGNAYEAVDMALAGL